MIEVFGMQVPTTLPEILRSSVSALLIIDMQNDYCASGGGSDASGGDIGMYAEIIPRIAEFARRCRSYGVPVIHVRLIALPNGESDSPAYIRMRARASHTYANFGESIWNFTVAGTWGAEFVDGLTPENSDHVITKYRSSALYNTDLDAFLRASNVKAVMVAGCTTEGCVESTVRDLALRDYYPVLLTDCVGSDVRELHDAALLVMSAYRCEVASAKEASQALNTPEGGSL